MKCPLCDSRESKTVFIRPEGANYVLPAGKAPAKEDGIVYGIALCPRCGLYFVENPPKQEDLTGLYVEKYFSTGSFPENDNIGGYSSYIENYEDTKSGPELRNLHKQRLLGIVNEINNLVESKSLPKWDNKKRLLDVGCGGGFFLEAAKNLGWETQGVELSEFASNYAVNKLSLRVHRGTIESAGLKAGFFDLATLFDVLEHSSDPVSLLSGVRRVLRDGGFAVIRVPNDFESYRNVLFKRIFWLIPPIHLFFFTKKTITEILNKTGFEVVGVCGDGWDSEFLKELRKFLGYHETKSRLKRKCIGFLLTNVRRFRVGEILNRTGRHYAYRVYARKV